jgi:predicted alpha/beta hydrolase family esterase
MGGVWPSRRAASVGSKPMNPVIIVPGLGGSGKDHWQTHIERSIPGASRAEQDDWHRPELARWQRRLASAVAARPGAILVAHSLGCPLVAHLAVEGSDLNIAAALLVAPADVDSTYRTLGHVRGFAPIPLRALPFRSIVVASTNDPYITIARAAELAAAWGSEFYNVGACGHINVESGFGPWPAGRRLIDALRGRPPMRRAIATGARSDFTASG